MGTVDGLLLMPFRSYYPCIYNAATSIAPICRISWSWNWWEWIFHGIVGQLLSYVRNYYLGGRVSPRNQTKRLTNLLTWAKHDPWILVLEENHCRKIFRRFLRTHFPSYEITSPGVNYLCMQWQIHEWKRRRSSPGCTLFLIFLRIFLSHFNEFNINCVSRDIYGLFQLYKAPNVWKVHEEPPHFALELWEIQSIK